MQVSLFLPSSIVKQSDFSLFAQLFFCLILISFILCVLCASVTSVLIPFLLFPHAILSPKMEKDLQFMQEALAEARTSASAGEVPIGAILVHDGKILVRSGNRTIRDNDPTAHAEIIALREAARLLGNYRLSNITLYVTVEPCSMCAGAIIQARVPRLVYGADDPKGGAVRSCFEILSDSRLNHQVEVSAGVLAAEAAAILQSFFAARR
jgi:tRNA(adenine34) deaminase